MKTLALRMKQAAEVSRSIAKLDEEMRGIVLRDANETYTPGLIARAATPLTDGSKRKKKLSAAHRAAISRGKKRAAKRGPGRPKGS